MGTLGCGAGCSNFWASSMRSTKLRSFESKSLTDADLAAPTPAAPAAGRSAPARYFFFSSS